jgi:hypothetical protein
MVVEEGMVVEVDMVVVEDKVVEAHILLGEN